MQELGIGFVPWSPLGQGFLTGTVGRDKSFADNDIRSRFPRFTAEALEANQPIVELVKQIAAAEGSQLPGQIALAWLLAKSPTIVPIPGSRKTDRVTENIQAADVTLTADEVAEIDDRSAHAHRGRRPGQRPRVLPLTAGDTVEIQPTRPTTKGPAGTFTGDVWVDMIAAGRAAVETAGRDRPVRPRGTHRLAPTRQRPDPAHPRRPRARAVPRRSSHTGRSRRHRHHRTRGVALARRRRRPTS